MSDSVGLKFEGFEELEKRFRELSDLDRKKFFVDEFKPIGDQVVAAMKGQSPVSEAGTTSSRYKSRVHPRGTLRESIGKKIGGDAIPTMWISPRRRERNGRDAWYSHIVIGGHEFGGTRVPPNAFVRRTFDAMKPFIESQLSSKLKAKISALLKK